MRDRNFMKDYLLFALCFFSLFTLQTFAQTTPKNAVVVPQSKIIEQINKRKEENPKVSAQMLAEFGNELLAQKGYEFSFASEQGDVLISNVDVDGDGFEIYRLNQIGGKPRLFATQAHGSHPCGTWSGLTVTNLNARQMTILADGKSYTVAVPKSLIFDDITLVGKNLKTPLRRWLTPLDATPEAISKDGKTVYVPSEIDEILLGIGENGNLSFVAAND